MSFSAFSLDESLDNLIELFSSYKSNAGQAFCRGFLPQANASSGQTNASQPPQAVEFLAGLQQLRCQLSAPQRTRLQQAIDTVERSLKSANDSERLRRETGLQHPDADQRQSLVRQLHQRLLGLLYGTMTAVHLTDQRSPDSDGATSADPRALLTVLNLCGQHFDAAWEFPLKDALAVGHTEAGRDGGAIADVESLLAVAASKDFHWTRHLSTWNTVRRLLRFLVAEADPHSPPDEQQTLPVLWVLRCDDSRKDHESEGVVRGIRIAPESNALGWYIDPVSFGVTLTDTALQRSVEIAGRLSWPGLKDQQIAVQISPGFLSVGETRGLSSLLLSGDSAGGLLGCGIYGLSRREQLDKRLTASLSLKLRDGIVLSGSRSTLTVQDIVCHGVGGGFQKLCAANAAEISGVALHSQNKVDAESFRERYPESRCVPEVLDSFAALYHYLTRGYRINQALQPCSQRHTAAWVAARQGRPLDGEWHHLDVFIKPRLSVRRKQSTKPSRDEEEWQELPAGVGNLVDHWFLPQTRWLVITEDAGGGKTVLTWYLAAALARHTPQFYIVRYEGRFPDDLRQDLQQRLASEPSMHNLLQIDRCTPRQILDDLLQQRRVVVIYDALDQDNSLVAAGRIRHLRRDSSDRNLRNGIRLIVTSRPYAVNQNRTPLFALDYWLDCRFEQFDDSQQQAYERQVARIAQDQGLAGSDAVREQYSQLIPDREAVKELLAYPVVQSLLRRLVTDNLTAANHGSDRKIRQIRNTGDLYWEVGHGLLGRAFQSQRYTKNDDDPALLFQILACYGYLMMLWYRDCKVPQEQIPGIHAEVRKRVTLDDKKWGRYSEILRDTYLTEHLLLKENDEKELSFPSLKMTEFFAAVWLACHCEHSVQTELEPWSGNEQWSNVWKLVAEMPETTSRNGNSVCNHVSLEYALHALFSVPAAGQTRPTEMMFRAWQVLTRNPALATVRAAVLDRWRAQFRSILIEGAVDGQPTQRARTAAEVLHQDDLQSLVERALDEQCDLRKPRLEFLQRTRNRNRAEDRELQLLDEQYNRVKNLNSEDWCQLIAPAVPAYCLCSDQVNGGDPNWLRFWMGASPEDSEAYDDEQPWQEVQIDAFHMAATSVTRAQYRLFDSQREHRHGDNFKNYAPDEDCPMICVNFYDGICFALWLGDAYCLPSEVEWEGAAWGGIKREEHRDYVIGVEPYTKDFDSRHVNFDGNHPLHGPKSEYRQNTVSVRYSQFKPNGFGLWQMSGNVREYTRSEWHESLQAAINGKNADLAAGAAGPRRCVRGGSWIHYARYSRCSYRNWVDSRGNYTGIRLSRTQ